jgi:hypothetical protein
VVAELAAARARLEAAGIRDTLVETETLSGVDVWAELLRESDTYGRIGLPPRDVAAYLAAHGSTLNDDATPHIVDFASGLIYLRPAEAGQVLALRQPALALGGYAVVVSSNGEVGSDLDRWGYAPQTLALMRRLKARWDPGGCLNPNIFL